MKSASYYTVKLEVLAPITLTYRILAESPEEALEKANVRASFSEAPKINFSKLRKIRATVYNAGTAVVRLFKNF